MKSTEECDCVGARFVEHIKTHLLVGQDVICKICGKTPTEIANEEFKSDACPEKSHCEEYQNFGCGFPPEKCPYRTA